MFKESLFGESTTRLVIHSYNLSANEVYLFRTLHAPNLRRDYKVPAWQVARATTAAPTYFPAFTAIDMRLIDGGVWANNPVMVAITESVGTLGFPLENTSMLSIGTCDSLKRHSPLLDMAGRFPWAAAVTHIFMDSNSTAVDNQARFFLGAEKYLRINRVRPGLIA